MLESYRLIAQTPLSKVVPQSNSPLQAVQLMQPVPPPSTTVPVTGLNSGLVDGAALTVVLTGIIGIVRMVLPQMFSTVKQNRAARFAAEEDSRHSELAIEAATAKTMQELITAYSASSLNSNASMTEALVNQISVTLASIVSSQARLVELVSQVANTQAVIAETQRRTVEVLSRVEEQLMSRGLGRRDDYDASGVRTTGQRSTDNWPKRRLDLPGRVQ